MEKADKQKAIIGAVVLGLIVIGLLLWYMATHQPGTLPPPYTPPSEQLPEGAFRKETLTDNGQYYDATATYPAETPLKATAGAEADAAAVVALKTFAESQIASFKENSGVATLTPEDIQMFGLNEGRKYTLDMDFEVSQSPKTVSFVYTIFQDTMGAHPNTYYRTFTFNLKTGAEVHLDDLFTGNYLERLSEISRKDLAESIAKDTEAEPDTDYIASGTLPIADSFQNFALKDNSFILIFPPYQVGPYVLGVRTVEIPLSEIQDILSPEYQ